MGYQLENPLKNCVKLLQLLDVDSEKRVIQTLSILSLKVFNILALFICIGAGVGRSAAQSHLCQNEL